MTALVLDASAFVQAFTESTPDASDLRHRIATETVHAPDLLIAEVGGVARRLTSSGRLTPRRGLSLADDASSMVTHFYAHGPLVRLAWSVRSIVSFYDGLYVALAASLGVTLLTADARLARAPGLPCAIQVVA